MSTALVADIVVTDTNQLIDRADSVIQQCNYPGCSQSPATQTKITQSVSRLSQEQAVITLNAFAIPISSVPGRNIFDAYQNLGSAVSSTYLYQCGSTTINSNACVNNVDRVKVAQQNLEDLLVGPVTAESNYLIGLSVLASLAVIMMMLFLIFILIGIFASLSTVPPEELGRCQCTPKAAPINTVLAINAPTIPVSNRPTMSISNLPKESTIISPINIPTIPVSNIPTIPVSNIPTMSVSNTPTNEWVPVPANLFPQ